MITDPDKIPVGDYRPLFEYPKTLQEIVVGRGKIWAFQNEDTLELISPECADALEPFNENDFQI